MSVSAVDDNEVDVLLNKLFNAVKIAHANGRADAQTPLRVATRGGIAIVQIDVANRHKAGELLIIVDEKELLNLALTQNAFRALQVHLAAAAHEPFPRHHARDGIVFLRFVDET